MKPNFTHFNSGTLIADKLSGLVAVFPGVDVYFCAPNYMAPGDHIPQLVIVGKLKGRGAMFWRVNWQGCEMVTLSLILSFEGIGTPEQADEVYSFLKTYQSLTQ